MGKAGRPPKPKSQQTLQIHSRYKPVVSYVKCDKCQMNIPIKGISANKNYALANHYRVCQSSTRNMINNTKNSSSIDILSTANDATTQQFEDMIPSNSRSQKTNQLCSITPVGTMQVETPSTRAPTDMHK